MKIIKRDNTTVDFDIQKIYRAISCAFIDAEDIMLQTALCCK